jgi:hypothetical protein
VVNWKIQAMVSLEARFPKNKKNFIGYVEVEVREDC